MSAGMTRMRGVLSRERAEDRPEIKVDKLFEYAVVAPIYAWGILVSS
jgi:hypothetical protein